MCMCGLILIKDDFSGITAGSYTNALRIIFLPQECLLLAGGNHSDTKIAQHGRSRASDSNVIYF